MREPACHPPIWDHKLLEKGTKQSLPLAETPRTTGLCQEKAFRHTEEFNAVFFIYSVLRSYFRPITSPDHGVMDMLQGLAWPWAIFCPGSRDGQWRDVPCHAQTIVIIRFDLDLDLLSLNCQSGSWYLPITGGLQQCSGELLRPLGDGYSQPSDTDRQSAMAPQTWLSPPLLSSRARLCPCAKPICD